MNRGKRVLMVSAIGLMAMGGLAACSNSGSSGADTMRATEAPPTVVENNLVRMTATVDAIDPAKRVVTLRGPQGRTVPVEVGPDIDLSKLKKGDLVDIAYYESVAVNVVAPGEAVPGVTSASDVARSQPGQTPGRAAMDQVTVTARVTAIDQAAHTVTFQGPQGARRTVQVKNPELQQKMKGLKVGDLVQLTYTEAVAAQLQPRSRPQ
ncbi:MAG: hypothetical protein JNM75_12090 [Rhodospirillales bacterium]|nr:hypothetical protein [Rhodospirillales bacterium]